MAECCSNCCTTMVCCEHGSPQNPPPKAPASVSHDNFQALIARTAAGRPVEVDLTPEKRQVPPPSYLLRKRSPDSPALLCVFLI